jgi:16S rRNA processing protein RimM
LSAPYPPVKDFFLVGKTLKSHGTAGQLRIMIEERLTSYVKSGLFVFFDIDGSRVPFKVKGVEEGQHFVISLEDVDGRQESDKLAGKEFWVPIEQVKPRHQKSPRNIKAKWEDYTILDEKTGSAFPILRTEEFPQQLMAIVDVNGKEILIPLHEQLIVDIDKDQKIIRMEIPEGLLEL